MLSTAWKKNTLGLAKSAKPQTSRPAQRRYATIEEREKKFEDKDVRDHDLQLALNLAKKLAVCISISF